MAVEVIEWAAYRKKGALNLYMLLDGYDLPGIEQPFFARMNPLDSTIDLQNENSN